MRKEKGTGTFVSDPAPRELKHKLERIYSFRDMLGQSNIKAKTIVLEKGIEKASEYVARTLFLGANIIRKKTHPEIIAIGFLDRLQIWGFLLFLSAFIVLPLKNFLFK